MNKKELDAIRQRGQAFQRSVVDFDQINHAKRDYLSLLAALEKAEEQLKMYAGFDCPYCGASDQDAEHDAICEKHLAFIRAQQAEEELKAVLGDWNALVAVIGSKTNGGAVGAAMELVNALKQAQAERDVLVRAMERNYVPDGIDFDEILDWARRKLEKENGNDTR